MHHTLLTTVIQKLDELSPSQQHTRYTKLDELTLKNTLDCTLDLDLHWILYYSKLVALRVPTFCLLRHRRAAMQRSGRRALRLALTAAPQRMRLGWPQLLLPPILGASAFSSTTTTIAAAQRRLAREGVGSDTLGAVAV